MTARKTDPFDSWFAALEARHLSDLSFSEVRRSVQALSSLYVERRGKIEKGEALKGTGKRAAFALYYAPLHFVIVREIVRALGAADRAPRRIVDLGCGTGAAAAAWAIEAGGVLEVVGVDRSDWAVEEARWNFRALGVKGRAVRQDLCRVLLPGEGCAILAAFTVNELPTASTDRLLDRLLAAAVRGSRVLVVEPVARRSGTWWERWQSAFASEGGRSDVWRFQAELPERLRLLDRAAGLDHRELTARSLWLGR